MLETTDSDLANQLLPDSDLHKDVVKKLQSRLHLSSKHISNRYDDWDRVDEHCRMYIDLARKARKGDKTEDASKKEMPFARSIVVPVSYAILQVRQTQLLSILHQRDPVISLKGRAPEDVRRAKIMEAVLAYDLEQTSSNIPIPMLCQDSEKYGMGIIYDVWERQSGVTYKPVTNIPMAQSFLQSIGLPTMSKVNGIVKEYNSWDCVDPFMFYPDPRVPVSKIQLGEFVGHGVVRGRHWLLQRAIDKGGVYFNLDKLQEAPGLRQKSNTARSRSRFTGDDFQLKDSGSDKDKDCYELVHMQVRLIPSEWGLGSGQDSEIWWFTIVDEALIIRAHKGTYDHDEFTYAVAESNPDTHCMNNQGQIENIDGLQRFMNWMVNSHFEATRKFLNDSVIFCPSLVCEMDLIAPGPVKNIRLTPEGEKLVATGKIAIQQIIQQLTVTDITSHHMESFDKLFYMAQLMSAATDPITGNQTSDKRTLGEVQQITAAASARIAQTAKMIDIMAIAPLARRAIANRQQFTSMEQYFRIAGDLLKENMVANPENPNPELQLVNVTDIQGGFDYVPITGSTPPDPARQAELWMKILEGAGKIPQLHMPGDDMRIIDMRELFNEACRHAGAKNIGDFYKAINPLMALLGAGGPGGNVQVQPDEQVEKEKQKGNIVLMRDAA